MFSNDLQKILPRQVIAAFQVDDLHVTARADEPRNIFQVNNSTNKGAAYGAFNPANGTSTVELPLIMDRNFDYYTGYSIANVGTTEVNITCTYTGSPDTPSNSTTNPLPPGGAFTIVNLNQLGNPYVGAATCLASNNNLVDTNPPQIVGIVNELNSNATSDSFLVYEGTNR